MIEKTRNLPNLINRVVKKITQRFLFNQWIILIARNANYKTLTWKNFKPIVPPSDRLWADPFLWSHKGRLYIFVEELLYENDRGHITCLSLDQEMNILDRQIVLERPYHLSYPYIFEHENQIYMIPETGENQAVEVYRCTQFPNQWEYEKTLISGVFAVDATPVQANGKWWLFANIKDQNGSTDTSLHLFHADHPLSEQWTPHPLNPIIHDIQYARPAGRIFLDNENLIRPSQDSTVRYGYAVNFNRITKLNETEYEEIHEQTFKPSAIGFVNAVHTFNCLFGYTVIDAKKVRGKFSKQSG